MADSKKYNGSTWEHSLRKLGTSTDTITTLPAVIHPTGTTAAVGLKGNTLQSSIPSPTSPVMPQGTGERTGNLFDISQVVTNAQVINQGSFLKVMIPSTTTGVTAAAPNTLQDYCPTLNIGDEVTLSFETTGSTKYIYLLGENITWSSGQSKTITATMLSSIIIWYASGVNTEAVISNIMINLGSTALPYEPWGIKIPISSANTTTPVYLGEVETTRKIKKLVFDGTETSWKQSAGFFYNDSITPDYLRTSNRIVYCTHYQGINSVTAGGQVGNGECSFYSAPGVQRLYICDNNHSTTDAFKAYLAQQYTAGTPVTVWYVLATPETGIANEPLMKIGDYADTVSGITIPTITGKDTFDVDTTLKPSEVSLSYTGWHDATVEEWDGSQWD